LLNGDGFTGLPAIAALEAALPADTSSDPPAPEVSGIIVADPEFGSAVR